MQTLNLNSFEDALAQINRQVSPAVPDHYVLNYYQTCQPDVDKIKDAIGSATHGQVLYELDLRTIVHMDGTPQNWSLEACSMTQSLGIIGELPSA